MIPGSFPVIAGKLPPTVIWTESAASSSASSPHTFTGMSLSTADGSRQIFVAVYSGVASAVTVGGISATLVENTASSTLTLWRAAVPTGTSASVVVTFTGGAGRLLITVWAAYNLLSTTPVDTAHVTTSSTPATTHTTTIDTADGGILIAAAATVTASARPTWTGATLRDNRVLEDGSVDFILSAGDSQGTAGATGATLRTTWAPAVGNVDMVGATYF